MKLQPIVYVTEMERSLSWYRTVLGTDPSVAGTHWTSFAVGDGQLALHITEQAHDGGPVELSLIATEPLELIAQRVGTTDSIADEAFGRSLKVTDPDGTVVQINEHDPELYDH